MNIDVIDRSTDDNGFLAAIRQMVESEIDVSSVAEMVTQVMRRLGPDGHIRRLRIFGHGNRGVQAIGGGQHPTSNVQWLTVVPAVRHYMPPYGTAPRSYFDLNGQPVENETFLRRLRGCFEPGAWVELHGCLVAAGTGIWLLRRLSHIWGVRVAGSADSQRPGGGFEGEVLWVGPGAYFERTYHY